MRPRDVIAAAGAAVLAAALLSDNGSATEYRLDAGSGERFASEPADD